MKRILIVAILLPLSTSSIAKEPRVLHSYGLGMDPFGGGVTYEYQVPQERPWSPQEATPEPQVWDRHDWLHWLHRGYQGGESGYHGPFDCPR